MVAPPPGSSDWSTVLEVTLMHVKVGNILTISLTRHLKNVVLVCEMLQKFSKSNTSECFVNATFKSNIHIMFKNVPLTFVQPIIFSQNIQK